MSQVDMISPRALALGLLRSIRDIDCRLDELRMIINFSSRERRKHVTDRFERLLDTRFKLMHSFMDVTRRNPTLEYMSINPFDYMNIRYDDLKRRLRSR